MKTTKQNTLTLTFQELFDAIEQYCITRTGKTDKIQSLKEVSYMNDEAVFLLFQEETIVK